MMAEPSAAITVLLVEDEPEIRRFIVRVLAVQGYQVLEAHDGTQALALCRQHPGPIHLLLTDVVIPDTSGPELAANIQAFHPQIHLLYISAFDTDLLKQNFGLNARAAFLQKPFDAEDLLKKVQDALQSRD
ncbi:MAG: response regulator [Nitrospirae bacterium]|nr:MAG: response regulator [Nitrospirota bacterium]